jgi:hypothetical protein
VKGSGDGVIYGNKLRGTLIVTVLAEDAPGYIPNAKEERRCVPAVSLRLVKFPYMARSGCFTACLG